MRAVFALFLLLNATCILAQEAEVVPHQPAQLLYQQGKITKSYRSAWRSLETTKSEYGALSLEYADNLRLLSLITASLHQDSLALEYTLREIQCREYLSPAPAYLLLEAYQNAANLYLSVGDTELAQVAIKRVLFLADSTEVQQDSLGLLQLEAGRVYQAANNQQLADSLYTLAQIHSADSLQILQAQFQQWLLQGKLNLTKVSNLMRTLQQRGDTTTTFYADLCYQRANIALAEAEWQDAQQWYAMARRLYERDMKQITNAYASVLNNLGAIALADQNTGEGGYLVERAFQYRASPVEYTQGSFWVALANLAAYYQEHSSPAEANALYTQHIHLDDTAINYPWQYAIALNNVATLYQDEGNYEQAAQYFTRAIEVLGEKKLPSQRAVLHQASVYSNAARNYQDLVRFDTAIFYHQKSLELIKWATGRESPNYVAAISGMAALYHDIGYLVEAEIFFQEAISIQERLSETEDNIYANLLSNYALVCQAAGNYPKAAEMLEASVKIKEKLLGTDHPEYLVTLSNIGLLYLDEGKYTQARPMLELVAEVQREIWGAEHPSMISSYLNLARLEVVTGNYPEAEPLLQQAYELSVDHFGENHPEQAKVQMELAKFYFTLGNFVQAKPLLLASQKILSDSYGASHPDLATAYQSLAALYEAQDSIELAEQYYQQALSIDANTLGKQHPSYAATLSNLATLYQNNNQYQKALPLLEESLSISQKLLGKDHPYYSTTLLNLGLLYQDLNELDKATEYIEEAVAVRQEVLGELHPDFAYARYSQAVLYHKLGRYKNAEDIFHGVVEDYIGQIQNYFPSLSEQEKGAYYQRVEPVFHAFRDFVIDQVYYRAEGVTEAQKRRLLIELYNLQLVTKAMLLDASYQLRQAIETQSETETVKKYERWLTVKEQLGQLYTLSRRERNDQRAAIQVLESEANQLEKQLSRKSATFATTVESKQVTWQQVQQQLEPTEAAVEIIRVARDSSVLYAALVIESTSEAPRLCVFPEGKEMESKNYYYYQNAIKFRITDELSYDQYWRSIREQLSDSITTVYLAPDGIYHKININSLYRADTKRYVIDEMDLRMLSSTRDLGRASDQLSSKSAYLIGSPDFQFRVGYQNSEALIDLATPSPLTASGMLGSTPFLFGIRDLPGTRTEVEAIRSMLTKQQWTTWTYLGEEAREDIIKSAKEPRVLHIASHGYFMTDLSESGNANRAYGTHLQNIAANPLLRAGLLLAGAEYSIHNSPDWKVEDGVLTAYEAMNLRLNGTEMVVLSACETGLGDIRNGEGVYGLQRSFLIAGAQSVLMSLWNVNDNSTAELMTIFYQNWLSGQSKHQALRNAQLAVRKQHADPYFWGGFVLVER
ncbi:CHAT domain-containing protein [Tunicatimonas pelagia]|uniref:CHAT domain-containing protein n=1 Tax=Tunicatimonas pelagia TaxID=931531 RepID=UPI0026662B42|nr:CHAT domain-containing protein [Tunicatimonas pelagia]WKN42385.1 CHAT domain-containing protein [Tunicatimonas pelagia]